MSPQAGRPRARPVPAQWRHPHRHLGEATLAYYAAPEQELDALAPVQVRRGYRYSSAFQVDDLDVLKDLT